MHKRLPLIVAGTIAAVLFGLLAGSGPAADADPKAGDWRPLFNGKDLTGWDTWLGKPHGSREVLGLNKDPKQVYTVVMEDGEPALRISGEIYGALTSKDEFENYRLRLEFKWGRKKWPPRENAARDSGLLYRSVGRYGAAWSFWMESLEFQIQEKDCGDFYSVAGPIVDVEGERAGIGKPITFKKGGEKFRAVRSRIKRDIDHEKPLGEWNTIELLTVGGTSVHVVNGKANMVLTNARHRVGDKIEPLTKGKIQLQSEGAEVFYRKITIRPLQKIPDEYLK
jgi:hypothetical protein